MLPLSGRRSESGWRCRTGAACGRALTRASGSRGFARTSRRPSSRAGSSRARARAISGSAARARRRRGTRGDRSRGASGSLEQALAALVGAGPVYDHDARPAPVHRPDHMAVDVRVARAREDERLDGPRSRGCLHRFPWPRRRGRRATALKGSSMSAATASTKCMGRGGPTLIRETGLGALRRPGILSSRRWRASRRSAATTVLVSEEASAVLFRASASRMKLARGKSSTRRVDPRVAR